MRIMTNNAVIIASVAFNFVIFYKLPLVVIDFVFTGVADCATVQHSGMELAMACRANYAASITDRNKPRFELTFAHDPQSFGAMS